MSLVARALDVGGGVIDTSWKVSASEAKALRMAGVRAIGRYVFFSMARPGDLDDAELHVLLDAGLQVFVIQHVRNPGWMAHGELGEADGRVAVSLAQRAGYATPAGSPSLALVLDMEGLGNPGVSAQQHAAAWCGAVRAAGYQPVVYVGYDSGLDAAALNTLPGSPLFWADYAPLSMRPAPAAGYTMHQSAQVTLAGIGVDPSTVLRGGELGCLLDADVYQELSDKAHADTEPPPPPEAA